MSVDKTGLGDRMKMYEKAAEPTLLPLLPVIARLDGKAFYSFTKGLARPYDERLSKIMIAITKYLVEETNACIGYTQSDEISLILYSDNLRSQLFMGGKHSKLVSILASMASIEFNKKLKEYLPGKISASPVFDCRVWTVPSKTEAINALIWREQDAVRNSIQMAAQFYFSHKEIMNKSCDELQEMMWQRLGINWNNYPDFFKRGTYVQRRKVFRSFTASELANLPPKHGARCDPDLKIERTEVRILDMPILTKIVNREEVVFDGKNAITS